MLEAKQVADEMDKAVRNLTNSLEAGNYDNVLYHLGCLAGYCKLLWYISIAALAKKDETEGD